MVYGTATDVQDLMAQFTIGATSTPTATQVGTILIDISNEIDVTLDGAGVAVPVSSPTHFVDWLGRLNAYGTASAVLKSMFPGTVGLDETPAYAFWEARYQAGLKGIIDRSMVPSTAVLNGDAPQPSTYFTRNPDTEETLGDIAEPMFLASKQF